MSRIPATDSPAHPAPSTPILLPSKLLVKPAGDPTVVKPVPLPSYANSPYPTGKALPAYANSPYPTTVPLPPPTAPSQPPANPPSGPPAMEAKVPVEIPGASAAPTTAADYGTMGGSFIPTGENIGVNLPPRGRIPSPAGSITVGQNGGGRGRDSSEGGTTKTLVPGTQEYNDWVAKHKKMQDTIALENGIIVAAATVVGGPLAGAAVKLSQAEQAKFEQQSSDAVSQGAFRQTSLPATSFQSPFGLSNMPPSEATSLGTQVNGVASTDQGFWAWFKQWIYNLLGITI